MADGPESDADAQNTGSDGEGRARPSRARRGQPKRNDKRPLAWVEESQGLSLIIAFHLNNEKVQKIVTSKPKKKTFTIEQERQERRRERDRERRERNRRAAQAARESPEVLHYPTIHIQHPTPFAGFTDKEPDEVKSKPYGGVLSEADADTSKTYPSQADRKRFDDARIKAEEEWKEKQAALYPPEPARSSKQAATASKIKCVNFGGWEIDTWHAAPYPEEYSKNRVLYICEFCLKYMNSDYVAWRHKVRTPMLLPQATLTHRSSNVRRSTLQAMRYIATANTPSSRSTVARTPSTAKIYACSPSSSWALRPSTTM
jgi:histone acetyltransferase SAS3